MFHQPASASWSIHTTSCSPQCRRRFSELGRNSIQLVMLKRSIFSWINSGILISHIATAPYASELQRIEAVRLLAWVCYSEKLEGGRWGEVVMFDSHFPWCTFCLRYQTGKTWHLYGSRCIASDLCIYISGLYKLDRQAADRFGSGCRLSYLWRVCVSVPIFRWCWDSPHLVSP